MKPVNKTTTALIASVLALALSLGVYAFFFTGMNKRAAKASEVALEASSLESKRGGFSQNVNLLKKNSADIEKINTSFIKESEVVLFTKQIESLGDEAGVNLVLESLDPRAGQGNTRVLGFRVKATGSFDNVMKLLKFFENYPAKFEFNGIRMFRSDESTTNPTWVMEVSIAALNFISE
jgi:hypothetical protein